MLCYVCYLCAKKRRGGCDGSATVEWNNSLVDGNPGEWLLSKTMNVSKAINNVQLDQPGHYQNQIHVNTFFYLHLHMLLLVKFTRDWINKVSICIRKNHSNLTFLHSCVYHSTITCFGNTASKKFVGLNLLLQNAELPKYSQRWRKSRKRWCFFYFGCTSFVLSCPNCFLHLLIYFYF